MYVENKILDLRYVNEIITDKDIEEFKDSDIFITTQTGTGKSYFIIGDNENKGLIDKIGNSTVLYLYNRKKLGRQIKIDLLNKYGYAIPNELKKLDELEVINNITVMSYQILESKIKRCKFEQIDFDIDQYRYIICDECHYFISDASFNNNTSYSFELLINGWCSVVSTRIFISATMDEVEKLFTDSSINPIKYDCGRDYSYLNVKYFKKHDTIITSIRNDETSDKWLIFVKSRKEGLYIKEELDKYNISSEYMDSNTKEDYINDCKFNGKVLITTKVLDNGINIKDVQVKHLVINALDKVTFIQELGRIRVDIKNARPINLYLNTMDGKMFNQIRSVLNNKKKLIYKYKNHNVDFNMLYSNKLHQLDTTLFIFQANKGISLNKLGLIKLDIDYNFTKYMIDKFKTDGKFAYIKEQLSWLGLEHTFNEDNFLDDKVVCQDEKEKLTDYIESLIGKKLFSDEQQKLSDMIINELVTIGSNVDYRSRKLKHSTIESILRNELKLEYALKQGLQTTYIDGKRKRNRYIEIVKL